MRLNRSRRTFSATLVVLFAAAAANAQQARWTPEALWQAWPDARFVTQAAPCLRHADVEASVEALAARHGDRLRVEEAGRSFEDRPIRLLTLGKGPRKVMLWSQMHGDEPSATPALFDLADFLLSRLDDPVARSILDNLTLLMVPMLNPDGSEIYERRNAQAIDVNRDALNLATPEGRILKRLRDEHEPFLGFNLHDQNRRTAVGDTGVLATNAVLAVAGDPEGTVTPGRLRAKRACAAIVKALAPFMPGGMARYDEDWSPRAFGDNLTAWGTPVVLIESGGLPAGRDFTELTRLNFVAISSVLQDLVRDDLAGYDPQVYEDLKSNQSDSWVDVVVRGGSILQPGTPVPYRADLAFNLARNDREEAGCEIDHVPGSRIFEIGDARFLAAGREVDASGAVVMMPFVAGVEGWRARRWLDGEVLERVAQLGVGKVLWRVKDRRIEAAKTFARRLEGNGRARLEPMTMSAAPPALTLTGPPSAPESDSLAAALEALGGAGSAPVAPGNLWPDAKPDAPPAIRRGRPASFLLVSSAGGGGFDLAAARLVSVWLDGAEVPAVHP